VRVPRRATDGRLDSRPSPDVPASPLPAGLHALEPGPGADAVLAVPPGEPAPHPLLVFFHGAGGTAGHGLAAVGELARHRGVLALAPTSVAATWDLMTGGLGRDVAVLDAALEQVSAASAVSRTAVAGFSDGASYALSLGLANGDLFEAVLAFSPGFAAPPGQQGRPRIWISHGTRDRVLPVERCGRRVARELGAAGYDTTYEEFDGGHVVTAELVTRALDWWLDER
jgi:phospholipase/carboxylesterase